MVGVRNGGPGLRASLQSVLSQDGVVLELIVVDDGSDDGTLGTLEEMAAADPRLVAVPQQREGLTRALRRGCSLARAQLVARHDVDDISLPGRLRSQVAALRADESLAFVSCWCRAVGPLGETLWDMTPPADRESATRALLDARRGPPHGTVLFRRGSYEQVGGYRPEFYFAQDVDLWLRLVDRGGFALVPELLYELRITGSSISSRRSRTQSQLGCLAHECRGARLRGQSEADLLKRAASLRERGDAPENVLAGPYFIGRCLARRRDPRALRYLWSAARQNPSVPRVWLGFLAALASRPFWRTAMAPRVATEVGRRA